MLMKGDDRNIWSSIQLLKRKLRNDRQQLQDIKNDMSRDRSRSQIRNKSLLNSQSNEKQNQPNLANLANLANLTRPPEVSDYRKLDPYPPNKSFTPEHSNSISIIQLRKQHKNAIKELTQSHAKQIEDVRKEVEKEIMKLKEHYETIIEEKDAHIRLLEETLAKELCEEEGMEEEEETREGHRGEGEEVGREETDRDRGEIESIKQHYEEEMQAMKQRYETIINNLSEQNQQLTARQIHTHQHNPASNNDVTFKNVRMLLKNSNTDHSNRLMVRIAQSQNNSFDSKQLQQSKFSSVHHIKTSHFQSNPTTTPNNLYKLFKDKFKFNKKSLIGSSNNVTSRCSLNEKKPRSSNSSSRQCTLQQAWKCWIGGEQKQWEDMEVQAEHQMMNTIRNIQTSLLN